MKGFLKEIVKHVLWEAAGAAASTLGEHVGAVGRRLAKDKTTDTDRDTEEGAD